MEKTRLLTNDHQFYEEKDEGKGGKNDNHHQHDDDIELMIPPDIPVEQGEVGDYILVDIDGYCCCSSNDREENIITQLTDMSEKTNSKSTITPFLQAKNWLITLGNGDVLPGLEMSIRFLKLHQCGIVKCHAKYAYGPYGRKKQIIRDGKYGVILQTIPDVPPNTNVIFKVKIKNILSQNDPKTQNNSFKIKLFQQMKKIGNHYYKYDWIGSDGGDGKVRALKLYNTISSNGFTLLQELDHGTSERRILYHMVVDSLNNISAVYLREKEYRKAMDAATKAIELDPYNMKALCRVAKAAMMVGEFDECKLALETAEEIVDNIISETTTIAFQRADILRLKRELTKKKREQKKLEKEIYSQMLSGKRIGKSMKKKIQNPNHVVNKKSSIHQEEVCESIRSNKRQSFFTKLITHMYLLVPVIAALLWSWKKQ